MPHLSKATAHIPGRERAPMARDRTVTRTASNPLKQVGADDRSSRLTESLGRKGSTKTTKQAEREGLVQSLSSNRGRTKAAFSSLRNIPGSLRSQTDGG